MRRLLVFLLTLVLVAGLGLAAWLVINERTSRAGTLGLGDVVGAPIVLELTPVVNGLLQPIYATHAGDASGRLFIVERGGLVRILEAGQLRQEPFLDLSERVKADGDEQGLFTLAFHPDYQTNGLFFVSYTAVPDGRSVVAEYGAADPAGTRAETAERVLLEVAQPTDTHNGGQIQFGPDGYLYIGFGDGMRRPSEGPNQSQDRSNLLGSLLRIDIDGDEPYEVPSDNPFVDSDEIRPEIWAFGFRSPWRFSFDRVEGDLYLTDVGEERWEEIDLIERGANYGWHVRLGTECRVQTTVGRGSCLLRSLGANYRSPLLQYGHLAFEPQGGDSIRGGYVYRGDEIPELDGVYLFGDYVSGRLWGLWRADDGWRVALLMETDRRISSIAEDEQGEPYLLDIAGGAMLRIGVASSP